MIRLFHLKTCYPKLFAHNNNSVIDFDLFGRGTNYQLDQYKKALDIVRSNNYDIAWPFTNLFRAYFFPNYNAKNENHNIQNLELADQFLSEAASILEESNGNDEELNEISHLRS